MTLSRFAACAIVGAVLSAGCSGENVITPPEIRLGRDECAECGMLIMEDRCSAARVVDAGKWYVPEVFDDIGCLFDRERDEEGVSVVERYFHDHDTTGWIPAAGATFVLAESIRTPMASGIVALGDADRARAKAAERGGAVFGYEALAEARAEAVRERARRSGG